MKPYLFNQEKYFNLNDLALAYIDNFNLGIEDIYTNYKKLIKFVKQLRGKLLANSIVDNLSYSTCKNNALTFIIFDFLDDKKVVINGKILSFPDFVLALKQNKNKENNVLFSFMKDYGISKTYAKMGLESRLQTDAFFLDKYYDNPFTYEYLTKFYTYKPEGNLETKFISITSGEEELFRKLYEAISYDFALEVAYRLGFREAIMLVNEINPVFYAAKALKTMNVCEEEKLRRIFKNEYFFHLLENIENYEPKSNKGKDVYQSILEVGKVYNTYLDMINKKIIENISFDLYVNLARDLYINYLNFVKLYRKDEIILKEDVSFDEFEFNRKYMNTYINLNFMKKNIITLDDNVSNDDGRRINPLTGEDVTDDNIDQTQVIISKKDENENEDVLIDTSDINLTYRVDDAKNLFLRTKKLSILSLISILIFGLISLSLFIIANYKLMGDSLSLEISNSLRYLDFDASFKSSNIEGFIRLSLLSLTIVLTVIFSIILFVSVKTDEKNINNLERIEKSKYNDSLSQKEEIEIVELEKKKEKLLKSLQDDKYKILSYLLIICAILSFSIMITAIISVIPIINVKGLDEIGISGYGSIILSCYGVTILSLLIVPFIKKRNQILLFILFALALIISIVSLLFI